MKKIINILFIFYFAFYFSQNKFTSDIVATYRVEYPIYKKKNTEQFILFISSKENASFYKSSNQYVLDSLKKRGNISSSNFGAEISYDTALKEEVLKKNNIFQVYEKVIDSKLRYIEMTNFQWKLTNERKDYFGYNTRKAFTFAYGRKWIAWYTEEIPLQYGPYKFSGLPGLIINLYDEKAEYLFTLSQFKKKQMIVQLPNEKKYKLLSKENFKKSKKNILFDINNSGILFNNPNERREMENIIKRRIDETPSLDIE